MTLDLAEHGERLHAALTMLVDACAPLLDARARELGVRRAAKQLAPVLRRAVMRMFVGACARARGMSVGDDAWPPRELAELGLDDASAKALRERITGPRPLELAQVPASAIGMLYETLLDHELRRCEVGGFPPRAGGATHSNRWQLVRWAGTRKGAGTFYTPLELAEPTIRRTLQPLTHERVADAWRVRSPEAIVALRVCDPAIGSGAFAIAALRWLADALREARRVHAREVVEPSRLAGQVTTCIHGVDLDPVAVELARLALWLEAGDPGLPPSAFDHALRCGNSLIGAAPERIATYPLAAFAREAVHGPWTQSLREQRRALERLPAAASPTTPSREAFDTWCSLWFWPPDALALAPTPADIHAPVPETLACVHALADEHRFFHWSLEFPEVFAAGGFDAVIGNPPWDIQKPNSKEFFSSLDPDYRGLDKQAALARQAELFAQAPEHAREWLEHQAYFKALAHWCSHAFHHQGSADLNTYKLFVELAHALLRPGGRLGLIVPSGIYSDKGTTALRRLLLDACDWSWCFGFENHAGIFAIDGRFKFAAIVAEKGGCTQVLQAAFMRRALSDWAAEPPPTLAYSRRHVATFSPSSDALIELEGERDLALLAKLYASGHTLGASSAWAIRYSREFDMTNDSALFMPWSKLARRGYVVDEHGHALAGEWQPWRGSDDILARAPELVLSRDKRRVLALDAITDVALPLYQGVMIHLLDFAAKGHGRGGWVGLEWPDKSIMPQYWIARAEQRATYDWVVGFRDIARTTDQRTMLAALLPGMPAGNKVPLLRSDAGLEPELAAVLCSYAFDWAQRIRQASSTLNHHVIADAPLPDPSRMHPRVGELAMRLGAAHVVFARTWLRRAAPQPGRAWRRDWALTRAERLRVRVILDVLIAAALGLDADDLAHVLRGCDHPQPTPRTHAPKGFWRIDKDQPPELRHTVLVRVAFHELSTLGIDEFMAQHAGEGWQLPEALRLADYGLGHDARARELQPVAARLGERWLAGQLEENVEASWAACARHAWQIERIRLGG